MNHYVNWHYKKYPLMTSQDLYLLLHQSEFAGMYKSKKSQAYQDLYEYISPNYVRVYLNPYEESKLDLKYLEQAYNETLQNNNGSKEALLNYMKLFNLKEDFPLEHSPKYTTTYQPNYLVIDNKYLTEEMKYVQISHFLSNIQKPTIISLEGKCGAGKTTLTEKIKKDFPITIINVDDFFLPQERKTKSRLAEIGGNIDYERIYRLLEDLSKSKDVTYFRYNCTSKIYEKVILKAKDIIILEGVYSYHPHFRKFMDKLIYLDITDDSQIKRLKLRTNFLRFVSEWIPLENKYFENENIKFHADLII